MRKYNLIFVLIFAIMFALFGCSCKKEETINQKEATTVLKESLVRDNVEITTTTETMISNTKSTSTQKDVYYQDRYFHSSENNNIETKTWYGEINNVLYAFYYTKNYNNEEYKTSSRIEQAQLDSIKDQPNTLINNLFDANGNLLENLEITGTKRNKSYTIQITNNLGSEKNTYVISITDAKITRIINTSIIANDYITVTYDYNYEVEEIALPSISEYPLNVNG